jgi:hypothetical protein
MSKLELLIKELRRVWEENNIEPALIDEMIDKILYTENLDKYSNIKEEDILKAKDLYLENKRKLEEERKKWEKPQTLNLQQGHQKITSGIEWV